MIRLLLSALLTGCCSLRPAVETVEVKGGYGAESAAGLAVVCRAGDD